MIELHLFQYLFFRKRIHVNNVNKVLKIDDKRKVAKVLSQHKNSPIKMKTPSKKIVSNVEMDTLQDAMKHKPIIHGQKKLIFTNEGIVFYF